MRREPARIAADLLTGLLPFAILFAAGFAAGWFRVGMTYLLAVAALLLVLAGFLALRLLRSAARTATAGLGPGGARDARPSLGIIAAEVRPAAERLDRAWLEETVRLRSRLSAAETVITTAPNPMILIDRERRIVRANPAATEFVGTAAEPRDLAAALRNPAVLAAADSVLSGAPAQSVEFALAAPVARQLEARFARISGPALDGAAAILTLHDVTALKRAEQMRADFIANAGHELKTPLATLIGFIETLLGPARDDPEAQSRFLAIMREEARRMARLVDDLRSLSRIEQNEHIPPSGRVALAPLVEHIAAALELRAAARQMRIRLVLPPDLPEVQGERDELAQVFQNLLDNALKYGRAGSEVAVSAGIGEGAAGLVWIAVTDHGDGIPREQIPRLTERFYRVDTARSRELGGTGLGLAIVKHIMNRHRGRLDISSALGHGSTFTVWLPAAAPQVAPTVIER